MNYEKPFDGFAFKKNGRLSFFDFGGYETRNESTMKLIEESVNQCAVRDFDWIFVNTGDRSIDSNILNYFDGRIIGYCTNNKRYDLCCPDFVFDHWRQTGLYNYESKRVEILKNKTTPLTSKIGWRGSDTHPARKKLMSLWGSSNFSDFELISWDRSDPNNLSAKNFLSFEEQIVNWRFLLDVEGVGYSGRLKLLLASNRCVFIQDRPYEEYFFAELKPWIHYVPVKNDLSDLEIQVDFILNNPKLEREIINQAGYFSEKYLSKNAALQVWRDVIES